MSEQGQTVTHPFEKAGLGKAPFRFTGMSVKVGPIRLSSKGGVEMWAGAPGQPMGSCDYCGNGIKFLCHITGADGREFVVGTSCVLKTDPAIYADYKAARRAERDAERAREWQEEREARLLSKRARVDAWIDEQKGLRAAFDVLAVERPGSKDQAILNDLHAKCHLYGSLSEKQVSFAIMLAERIMNPQPAEVHVPAPEGRQTFRCTVVRLKEEEDHFSPRSRYSSHVPTILKATVKVQAEGGVWLCWMTVPSVERADTQVGREMTVTATLSRGRDAHFAFGKRPVVWTEQAVAEAAAKAARKAARGASKKAVDTGC